MRDDQTQHQPTLDPNAEASGHPPDLHRPEVAAASLLDHIEKQLQTLRGMESERESREREWAERETALALDLREAQELAEQHAKAAEETELALDAARAELREAGETLTAARIEIEQIRTETATRIDAITQERDALASEREQFSGRIEALETQLRDSQQKIAEIEQQSGAIDQRQVQLKELEDRLTRESEELRSGLETLAEREAGITQRERELQSRTAALDERTATLQSESESIVERIDAVEVREQAIEEREAAVSQRERAAAERERIALQRTADASQEAKKEIEALQTQLAEARKEAESLRAAQQSSQESTAEVTRLQQQIQSMQTESEAAEQTVVTLQAQIDELNARVAHAEERAHELEAIAENTTQLGTEQTDDFAALRRRRLTRYKALLQQEAAKLYTVKQKIQEKQRTLAEKEMQIGSTPPPGHSKSKETREHEQFKKDAERVRYELQTQRDEIEQARRLIEAKSSKSKAGAFVMWVMIACIVAIGASWIGVRQFVPATYAAQSVLAIEQGPDAHSDAALSAWSAYLLSLPQDPQFLERASARLRSRGYSELATPVDLRNFLVERCTIESPEPGIVNISALSEGQGRTERMLETLSTAMIAYANDTRTLRADGAATRLSSPARVSADPADDPRTIIFGFAASGAILIVFIGSIVAWKILVRTLIAAAREPETGDPFATNSGAFA
ncbi:MAG: hypothetical protein EA380_00475 [Phycisphaeraceae bacterium]|nr:MAG: hypothetical protein EA380_00475 [Phycisphaeraceae bacterium]